MDGTGRNPAPTASAAANPLEESLKASEERFRAAFDQSVMGMAMTDLDGVIERVNDAFCRIVRRPPEVLLGSTTYDITHPEDRQNTADAIRQVRDDSSGSANYEKRYVRPDGTVIWTRVNLSLVRDGNGRPRSLIATVEDIREQRRTQAILAEREQRLRLVFESITDYAILTVDPTGIVTSWNSGAEEIFGYTPEEIIGQDSSVLWVEEDRANAKPENERQRALEAGRALDERWHARKGGERFFASGVMRPILDANGGALGFTKVCRDVTAQQQAEQMLAEGRARVAAALESERARLAEVFRRSPSFLAILDGPNHVFELVNDRYYQLVGHRDILGKAAREALPEIEGQGFFEILDRVYATGEPFVGKEMPVLVQRHPGQPLEQCYVDLVYMPTRDANGEITGIFAHGNDITDRKLAERSLERQARTFDVLLSAIQDYVFIFDRQLRFIYANKILLELWGLSAEQAIGKTMPELQYPQEVEVKLAADVRKVFETGEALRSELAYTSPTGASGYFEYILAPVRNATGEVESVAGTSRDISGRKRAAEERDQLFESERAARAEAERASRMKDEFLATLSHELRTPLNAILGWATILGSGATAAEISEGVEVIERNARAQARIIDDLLDMSRIISGKVRLDVQRVDLASVLEAAIGTVRPAADAKGVRLQAVLDPLALPVSGDPSRLQQVFWNLLTNAVKFTPRGGRVQVLLERVDSHLEASVIDTGEGIAPEFLPHVFDRFRQADASTTRPHGGLGLGLAIVKQLVELHGGEVIAKSGGVGRGSTFTVVLPLSVLHSEAAELPERRHPRGADRVPLDAVSSFDLSGVNILVVDDEPDARALIARLLTSRNAAVRAAASASEALEMLQQEQPHVLISDIGMPMEDGYSLIRRIRALGAERGGNVPALALTAYARAEDRMKAVLSGFQMHVAKPVEPAELLAMVASLAGRAK
jgi:PAS domain S-box-containing protein